jgi:MFS family permease
MFSLLMPVVALSPSFAVFVAARALLTFALNGEWSPGSMLVAETWPAHLRGRVISINRAGTIPLTKHRLDATIRTSKRSCGHVGPSTKRNLP